MMVAPIASPGDQSLPSRNEPLCVVHLFGSGTIVYESRIPSDAVSHASSANRRRPSLITTEPSWFFCLCLRVLQFHL